MTTSCGDERDELQAVIERTRCEIEALEKRIEETKALTVEAREIHARERAETEARGIVIYNVNPDELRLEIEELRNPPPQIKKNLEDCEQGIQDCRRLLNSTNTGTFLLHFVDQQASQLRPRLLKINSESDISPGEYKKLLELTLRMHKHIVENRDVRVYERLDTQEFIESAEATKLSFQDGVELVKNLYSEKISAVKKAESLDDEDRAILLEIWDSLGDAEQRRFEEG